MKGRVITGIVLAILIVVFAVINTNPAPINIFGWHTKAPTIIIIVISFIVGLIIGLIPGTIKSKIKNHRGNLTST
jgi:uncharacterized integral membrane protein